MMGPLAPARDSSIVQGVNADFSRCVKNTHGLSLGLPCESHMGNLLGTDLVKEDEVPVYKVFEKNL